jgi:hypothetical protein
MMHLCLADYLTLVARRDCALGHQPTTSSSGLRSRELTDPERRVLAFLLTRDFPGRDILVRQAETVMTGGSSCDCGCPSFSLRPDVSLPQVTGAGHMVSDAHGLDPGNNSRSPPFRERRLPG